MSRRGWVLFVLMGVIWGIPYLLIKVAVEGVSAPMVVFARTAIGAVVLLPLAIRGGELDLVRRHWRPALAFAMAEIIIPWLLLSDAERGISSSLAGLLVAAVPIVGVLLAKLTGSGERLGPLRWTGLAVGLGGVALLSGTNLVGETWSVIEVLLVALCYGVGAVIATRWLAGVPTMPLTASCLALAALLYAPPALLTLPDEPPTWRVLTALAALGLVCTALAFVVFLELIREVGTSRGLVFTYVNPAVAVAAGVVFLGEPLSLTIAAGFTLILGGSVLATAPRAPRKGRDLGEAPEREPVRDPVGEV